MCNMLITNARLPGLTGPVYPEKLRLLHQTMYGFYSPSFTIKQLRQMLDRIRTFFKLNDAGLVVGGVSIDTLALFKVSAGNVLIAFPEQSDKDLGGGTRSAWHTALYTSPRIPLPKAETVVAELLSEWKSLQRTSPAR